VMAALPNTGREAIITFPLFNAAKFG